MNTNSVIRISELGMPWVPPNPFLLCVYHTDSYPCGNANLGPYDPLDGRRLGNDFGCKDGWSMYHGETVPGFPAHPHPGFETVTFVRRGFVDHADSLGASARYGAGDVQWLTAGRGMMHSEMLPLLNLSAPNPLEMFQVWLNLPSCSKMADPRFTMYWAEDAVHVHVVDSSQAQSTITCIAGVPNSLAGNKTILPPPRSWAAQREADVAIWIIKMGPNATLTLPSAISPETRRTFYFFSGDKVRIAGTDISRHSAVEVLADTSIELHGGSQDTELLMLQGRPIDEPVVQHGPFVMNTLAEIDQTLQEYRRTQFGGWPWPNRAPVHPRTAQRFASYPDGTTTQPASMLLNQSAKLR